MAKSRLGIQKGQTRIEWMDDKSIGLYAAGLSTRDIRAHLVAVHFGIAGIGPQPINRPRLDFSFNRATAHESVWSSL